MILLNYRDTRPIYVQVSAGIRQQIAAGVMRPGEKLESVREMAPRLAINPNTIQRAYRELEEEGWIASMPGKGSFVCGVPQKSVPEEALRQFDTLVSSLLAQGVEKQQLMARLEQLGGSCDAET